MTAANEETVVYLVGAGAVENAWAPVLRAVRAGISPATSNDTDLANLHMARLKELRKLQATNWDSSIDSTAKAFSPRLEVFHLHGCASDCDSLYLPTEISDEHYRSEKERKAHARASLEAIDAFEQATQLVIYGCALSPLDAELVQVLSSAKHTRKLRRAHVVDLHPEPVAKRLAALLEDAWPDAGIHCEIPGAAAWELCRATFSGT